MLIESQASCAIGPRIKCIMNDLIQNTVATSGVGKAMSWCLPFSFPLELGRPKDFSSACPTVRSTYELATLCRRRRTNDGTISVSLRLRAGLQRSTNRGKKETLIRTSAHRVLWFFISLDAIVAVVVLVPMSTTPSSVPTRNRRSSFLPVPIASACPRSVR